MEAATGASPKAVGKVLGGLLPNIISKPLTLEASEAELNAQMLEIERTLRATTLSRTHAEPEPEEGSHP